MLRGESPECDLREEKNLSFIGSAASGCKDSWGAELFAEGVFIIRLQIQGNGKIGGIYNGSPESSELKLIYKYKHLK